MRNNCLSPKAYFTESSIFYRFIGKVKFDLSHFISVSICNTILSPITGFFFFMELFLI